METHVVFCSARDQNVLIVLRYGEWRGEGTGIADYGDAAHCREYGVRCTGEFCPHFRIPVLSPEELSDPTSDPPQIFT